MNNRQLPKMGNMLALFFFNPPLKPPLVISSSVFSLFSTDTCYEKEVGLVRLSQLENYALSCYYKVSSSTYYDYRLSYMCHQLNYTFFVFRRRLLRKGGCPSQTELAGILSSAHLVTLLPSVISHLSYICILILFCTLQNLQTVYSERSRQCALKCNQCESASVQSYNLGSLMQTQVEEKCNECDRLYRRDICQGQLLQFL